MVTRHIKCQFNIWGRKLDMGQRRCQQTNGRDLKEYRRKVYMERIKIKQKEKDNLKVNASGTNGQQNKMVGTYFKNEWIEDPK
jgi:hypothetical protein